jgi:transformation/transcription domain-associated protein
MAAASSSAGRTGRPRKASTATPNPLPIAVTPTVETPTPSAAGVATSMPAPSLGSNGPMTPAECEQLAAQLTEPGVREYRRPVRMRCGEAEAGRADAYTHIAMRRKLDIAAELRDSAESNRDHAFYEKYLAVFIPVLMTILGDSKSIIFIKENAEQVRPRQGVSDRRVHDWCLQHSLTSVS